ncbi:MAG: DMT family transporter [Anaerolineae bacterium]|nr:DMT family transporter [Anaerolineae bacterium]
MNIQMERRAAVRLNLAFAAMIAAAALWGSGTVLSKYVLDYMPPLTLVFFELLASCSVLWFLFLQSNKRSRLNRRTVRHAWAGILDPSLTYLFFALGLTLTSASNATLIMASEPVIVIGLAWLLLRERIPPHFHPIVAAATLGTLLVSLSGSDDSVPTFLGDIFVLLGTVSTALYTIVSRASARHMPPLLLAMLQQTCGLFFIAALMPLEWLSLGLPTLAQVPLYVWLLITATGVTQGALALWLYLRALKVISATQAALLLTLIPIFGVSSAALLLGEQMTWWQFIGGGLILAALFWLRVRQAAVIDAQDALSSPVTTS